jgi:hypothetical protein
VNVLIELLACLSWHPEKESIEDALIAIRELQEDSGRVKLLCEIAPYLPDYAIEEARKIQNTYYRVRAFLIIAHRLPQSQKEDAITEAYELFACSQKEELFRLAALFSMNSNNRIVDDSLATTLDILDKLNVKKMSYNSGNLSKDSVRKVMNEVMIAIDNISDNTIRAKSFIEVIPLISWPLKREGTIRAMAAIREIKNENIKAEMLSKLIPHIPWNLTEEDLQEALAIAQEILDDEKRANILSELAPQLSESLMPEFLAEIRKISDMKIQTKLLSLYAPCIPKKMMKEALECVQEIHEAWTRNVMPPSISHHDRELLDDLMAITFGIPHMDWQIETLPIVLRRQSLQSPIMLYPAWCKALHALSNYIRADFFYI